MSRAAARLNVSQPAVSRQLRDLEEELGTRLLRREPQGVTVTESGATAVSHAKDLLRRANALVESVRRASERGRKTLQVGFIPTALSGFLAEGMRRFNERHADVCVQIREMSPRQQEVALREEEIDLALLGSVSSEARREFATAPILKAAMSVVLPDHHLFALRKSIDLIELADERFVSLHERHFPGRPELMSDLGERAGFAIEVGVKADGLSEALGMIAGGAGVAVLPEDVEGLPHPGVVFVKMRSPRLQLTSSAAWRRSNSAAEVEELVLLLQETAKGNRRGRRMKRKGEI